MELADSGQLFLREESSTLISLNSLKRSEFFSEFLRETNKYSYSFVLHCEDMNEDIRDLAGVSYAEARRKKYRPR